MRDCVNGIRIWPPKRDERRKTKWISNRFDLMSQSIFHSVLSTSKCFVEDNRGIEFSKIAAAESKLPLAPARVLSLLLELTLKATRALANQSAHIPPAPIRTPRPSCANQTGWAAVMLNRQRRILTNMDASRLYTHAQSRNITHKAVPLPKTIFRQRAFFTLGSTTSYFKTKLMTSKESWLLRYDLQENQKCKQYSS